MERDVQQPIQRHGARAGAQGGFTLIELLVALSVTVIGLIGILSLHMATSSGNRIASQTAEATTIAQRTMDELRTMTIDAIVADHGGTLPFENSPILDSEVYPNPVPGRAGMQYYRRLSAYDLSSMSTNLVRLRVEVRWTDDGTDPSLIDPDDIHRVSLELIRTRLEAL